MKKVKHVIQNTLLRPPFVKYCSQTIYEALIGCCKIYESTENEVWKKRAYKLFNIIEDIQQKDGGFDIGYDFNFGLLHKKDMSTSPEMVSLMAVCQFYRLFEEERAKSVAEKAIEWIKKHSKKNSDDTYFIPYSPDNTDRVMVYNGVSFVAGALGVYIGTFMPNDPKLNRIYKGMIKYLSTVTVKNENGIYWLYYDQTRKELSDQALSKIDYYHQMQQVNMHMMANRLSPDNIQLELIKNCSLGVYNVYKLEGYVPYINDKKSFGGNIHLWGYSSVAMALFEVSSSIQENSHEYYNVATSILDWIIKKAWNDVYFEPVLSRNGNRIENVKYMVRSDAWVFDALATGIKYSKSKDRVDRYLNIAEKCYNTMEVNDFSGLETHASNKRTRLFSRLITLVK